MFQEPWPLLTVAEKGQEYRTPWGFKKVKKVLEFNKLGTEM